ncbi:hypothetical protein [Micromonospora sp. HM5-17]|jgi:hypothetical protein|uniref:hypothetical protein n=1 Tax=Micromonospora sp. HM5-17 TaxID=2487710 RepID=UPI000F46373C|nr:hypothetical protein [Micromonospora sp. HM5-17]ROT31093.1 hypothetical protein EF879_15755 [Micromonospora sp. HM5-17]
MSQQSRRSWSPPRLLQLASGARRRADQATDRIVRRIGQLRYDPVANLPRATGDFVGVLDGRTLQVHAVLPAGVERPDQAELLLLRGRHVRRCPASVRTGPDGRPSVEALVRLGEEPGELPLSKGTWSLAVAVAGAGGERRYGVRIAELPERPGPTVEVPPHPVSGWTYWPGRGVKGVAQLTVTGPAAQAEVTALDHDGAQARIRARLVGVRRVDGPALVFSPRGGGPDRVVPVDVVDGRFEAVVPVADLATGAPGDEVIWDVRVRVSPARLVRIGRFLHDLREPRAVLLTSRVILPIGGDDFVGYRPYYTASGGLAVALLRFTRFTGVQS